MAFLKARFSSRYARPRPGHAHGASPVHVLSAAVSRSGTIAALQALLLGSLLALVALAGEAAERAVTDSEISGAIAAAYARDSLLAGQSIEIVTRDGIVTLDGETDNLLGKRRAARLAESFRGVRAVVNRIEVAPSLPAGYSDANLQLDVEITLAENPVTEVSEVHTSVRDGIVTLTGQVDSWAEKQIAAQAARRVRGVRAVENRIALAYPGDRPDDEIRQEIVYRLANDVRIDDIQVRVAVNEGRVTLGGTVGSPYERQQAYVDAWVGGVTAVDASGLKVADLDRDRLRRSSGESPPDDAAIARALRDAFDYDPRIPAGEPDLAVADGVVTLSGVVSGLNVKSAAVQDAHNVVGVRRVEDRLQLQSRDLPAPEALEARVRRVFGHDALLADADIEVKVTAPGTVELTGSVSNSYLKFRAAELATSAVNGVTQLLNRIRYDYVWRQRPDREIRQEVQELLFWNRFVDEDRIGVEVSNGIVTLTGRVDNRSEAGAALSSAWEAEPRDVRNELSVTREQEGPYFWDRAYDLPFELASAGNRTVYYPPGVSRRQASDPTL